MELKAVSNVQTAQQLNSQNVQALNQKTQFQETQKAGKEQKVVAEQLKQKVDSKVIEQIVEELKNKLSMLNTQLEIKIDKETQMTVVKVVDRTTNKVIRQIPPEYILKIAKYLDEIAGLLLEEKA